MDTIGVDCERSKLMVAHKRRFIDLEAICPLNTEKSVEAILTNGEMQ